MFFFKFILPAYKFFGVAFRIHGDVSFRFPIIYQGYFYKPGN